MTENPEPDGPYVVLCVGFFTLHMHVDENLSSMAHVHMTTNFYGHKFASKYVGTIQYMDTQSPEINAETLKDSFFHKFKTKTFAGK
jgi:hypothetical protein